ncbi:ATP12 family protein [Aureimonas sp. AU12]|uniref:ATP12 family chaperone protein n=1 Tax=Aureimonas sp. AU12 TaxID=1638161 RepID=UPI0007825EE8
MSNTPARPTLPKRFYKEVSTVVENGVHMIRLDGRPVKTPARSPLAVPDQHVAEAIAAEWEAQREEINPATMPVTRLVNTVIDGIAPNLQPVQEDLERYAETDLLAYRASGPDRLVERQRQLWNPVVAWVESEIGSGVAVGEGVVFVEQPAETIGALRDRLAAESEPFRLAALHQITTLTGSLFVALAVAGRRLTGREAWSLAHVDEDWNIELWGADEEAAARRERRFHDMAAACLLLSVPVD